MNTQQLALVTYEQAKRLKALGFDWGTSAFWYYNPISREWAFREKTNILTSNNPRYDNAFSAPTVALALEYVEQEKNIICETFTQVKHFRLEYRFRYRVNYAEVKSGKVFETRRLAASALLDEVITLIEKQP